MDEQNEQQTTRATPTQPKNKSWKHPFGSAKLNHFKDEVEQNLTGNPTVGSRAERDTAEFKQKRLGQRLNVAILVLIILLGLVLAFMRFVG